MKRSIEKELKAWKERGDRKPLLVRGARQVGKTFVIEKFGKEHFESLVTLNFEEMKELKASFRGDLNPALIIRDLAARIKTRDHTWQNTPFFLMRSKPVLKL